MVYTNGLTSHVCVSLSNNRIIGNAWWARLAIIPIVLISDFLNMQSVKFGMSAEIKMWYRIKFLRYKIFEDGSVTPPMVPPKMVRRAIYGKFCCHKWSSRTIYGCDGWSGRTNCGAIGGPPLPQMIPH